jgi:AraC-like DNA-binding protein
MDVLTDVLRTVRLRSHVYGRIELTAPWGLRFGAGEAPVFHIVSRGSCWLELEGAGDGGDGRTGEGDHAVPLAGGDFVFLPQGHPHALRDALKTPALPVEELVPCTKESAGTVHRLGGGGAPATLVSGCFLFEQEGKNPLIDCLPPMIHVKSDGGPAVRWLEATLQFMSAETASRQPGTTTVVSRLADILFVQALRTHIANGCPESGGWLRALTDPQIGTALRLMHERPQEAWTVERLAEEVAMSRSAFAARFKVQVGDGPLGYLTHWRMQKAAQMLQDSHETLGAVARAVGYETDAAFGKSFRRHIGITPGEYRSRVREGCPLVPTDNDDVPCDHQLVIRSLVPS